MKRWAELLISKVKKDEQDRIIKVKVKIDIVNTVSTEVELSKENIIELLKDDARIKTIYLNNDIWNEGATVTYYRENNGIEYLKTNSNKTSKDNLDNLPTY